MNLNTLKWIYQRVSPPIIIILFFWIFAEALKIQDFNYKNINIFFINYLNLFLFITLMLMSLLHTSIEIFHSIHDYFAQTKNENFIGRVECTKNVFCVSEID